MGKIKGWKKIQNRVIGRHTEPQNISIIYQKRNITLELFKDSTWGVTNNMNVIIRDSDKSSMLHSLGRTIDSKHLRTKGDAETFAKNYMRRH